MHGHHLNSKWFKVSAFAFGAKTIRKMHFLSGRDSTVIMTSIKQASILTNIVNQPSVHRGLSCSATQPDETPVYLGEYYCEVVLHSTELYSSAFQGEISHSQQHYICLTALHYSYNLMHNS